MQTFRDQHCYSLFRSTFTGPVKKINKINKRCQLSSLQPMTELQRKRLSEIGRQHVKGQSCSHFSSCFDHTLPTQTNDGTSQILSSPTLFEQCHRFFYVLFRLKYKDERDKANGLMSPPNDTII